MPITGLRVHEADRDHCRCELVRVDDDTECWSCNAWLPAGNLVLGLDATLRGLEPRDYLCLGCATNDEPHHLKALEAAS